MMMQWDMRNIQMLVSVIVVQVDVAGVSYNCISFLFFLDIILGTLSDLNILKL